MCGQISYQSDADPAMTAVCHCPDCQKQTGTSFSIIVGIPLDQLELSGDPSVYTTRGESGAGVHRRFCSQCGSPVYSVADVMAGVAFIKAGTLDDTSWLKPTVEFFCDTAQPWVELKGEWERAPRNPSFG